MSFETDIDYGKVGERKFIEDVWKMDKTKALIDVTDSGLFFPLDVDYLVVFNTGESLLFEIKSDRNPSINMVYELTSCGNIGCLARSIANYVYYYKETEGISYVIDLKKLRSHIKSEKYNEVNMGDGAIGYLVPLPLLVEKKIAFLGEKVFK